MRVRASGMVVLMAACGVETGIPPLIATTPDAVVMSDRSDGLHITIQGGNATGYEFGGFLPGNGTQGERCLDDSQTICHPLSASGGFIPWSGECAVATPGRTCVPQFYYRTGSMSFVLRANASSRCWTWGDNTAVYTQQGCERVSWNPSSYR